MIRGWVFSWVSLQRWVMQDLLRNEHNEAAIYFRWERAKINRRTLG